MFPARRAAGWCFCEFEHFIAFIFVLCLIIAPLRLCRCCALVECKSSCINLHHKLDRLECTPSLRENLHPGVETTVAAPVYHGSDPCSAEPSTAVHLSVCSHLSFPQLYKFLALGYHGLSVTLLRKRGCPRRSHARCNVCFVAIVVPSSVICRFFDVDFHNLSCLRARCRATLPCSHFSAPSWQHQSRFSRWTS